MWLNTGTRTIDGAEEAIMAFEGHLRFFSPRAPVDPRTTAARVLDAMPVKHIRFAIRTVDRTGFWLQLAQGLARIEDEPEQEFESIDTPTREQALDYLQPHKHWLIEVRAPDRVDPALAIAVDAISPNIRGDWALGTHAFCVEIGPHECMESVGNIIHFGHEEISVTFSGHGSPNDWATCRRMVLELPEVKAFAKRLEPILGEVKTCVYWDG